MKIWERSTYKLYRKLNSKKPEKRQYDCRIRFSTNPEDWHRLNNYERDRDGILIVKDYLGQFTPLKTDTELKIKSIPIYLPNKIYESIIKNECFVLCSDKNKGYLYNPATLKEYRFQRGIIKDFRHYNNLHEFKEAVQFRLGYNKFIFMQIRWSLESNGRIKIF